MERRDLLHITLLATVSLILKGPFRAFAAPENEKLRLQAPVNPWDKVDFTYKVGERGYPGTAVRLPKRVGSEPGEIYAACRICPHQGCQLNYEMDFGKIGDLVGVTLENPVFFCRCHMSIFDPAQKGKIAFGPANRPPWFFSVRLEKSEMIIEEVERGVGEFG